MENTKVNLPVFPLPVFLLPGGITRLRIFEPRYLKMVGIAIKAQGFVIFSKVNENLLGSIPWGSWVDIINFNQGEDGVLEIDVKCKSLVSLFSLNKGDDNLHFSEVSIINHWSQISDDTVSNELAKPLANIFESDPLFKQLYADSHEKNSHWIIARWLELLPVRAEIKNTFIEKHGVAQAKKFVQSIIFNEM